MNIRNRVARLALCSVVLLPAGAQTPPASNPPSDNAELQKIQEADQADRQPSSGSIDWSVITVRDRAREARAEELYRQEKLLTGTEIFKPPTVPHTAPQPHQYLPT